MAIGTKRRPKTSTAKTPEWVWPDLSTALDKRNSGPYQPPRPGSQLPFKRLRLKTRPIDSVATRVVGYHKRLAKVETEYEQATAFKPTDYRTASVSDCDAERMARRQALVTALQQALEVAIAGIELTHELRKAWQAEAERLREQTPTLYAQGERQLKKIYGEHGVKGHNVNGLPSLVQNRKDVQAASTAMNSAIGDKRELELAMEGICLELRQMIDYFRS